MESDMQKPITRYRRHDRPKRGSQRQNCRLFRQAMELIIIPAQAAKNNARAGIWSIKSFSPPKDSAIIKRHDYAFTKNLLRYVYIYIIIVFKFRIVCDVRQNHVWTWNSNTGNLHRGNVHGLIYWKQDYFQLEITRITETKVWQMMEPRPHGHQIETEHQIDTCPVVIIWYPEWNQVIMEKVKQSVKVKNSNRIIRIVFQSHQRNFENFMRMPRPSRRNNTELSIPIQALLRLKSTE